MPVAVKSNPQIQIPDALMPLVNSKHRYNVLYGGRGGAKSWTVAQLILTIGMTEPKLILCTREIQNTIRDSVHRLLSSCIDRMEWDWFYTIQKDSIIGRNGTQFIFKGLRHNIGEIKSTEGVDICWLEEAHSVSKDSWDILIPTIRKEGSQFYIVFNPDNNDDPTYTNFVTNPREDSLVINVNYWDNPFFPDILRREMEYDKRTDYEKYLHVWEGQTRSTTDAQVFKGKYRVDVFEAPKDTVFYYGADWGFSQDPTVLVRCYIVDRTLYIDYEAYGVGVDIDETPQLFESVPGAVDNIITADSARPETISYMRKQGYNVRSAKKGAGSIIDGIAFLRSFEEIVIHERCKQTQYEFKYYSYKTDRLTGEVLPVLIDKANHVIDSLRYACESVRKNFGALRKSKINAYSLGI